MELPISLILFVVVIVLTLVLIFYPRDNETYAKLTDLEYSSGYFPDRVYSVNDDSVSLKFRDHRYDRHKQRRNFHAYKNIVQHS